MSKRPRASSSKAIAYAASSDEEDAAILNKKSNNKKKRVINDESDEYEAGGAEEEEEEAQAEADAEEEAAAGTAEDEANEDEEASAKIEEDNEDEDDEEEEDLIAGAKLNAKPRRMMNLDGKGGGGGSGKPRVGLDETLPPITALPEMFADLVKNADRKLNSTIDALKGRSLRVATMCSGTESPLLALDLISKALQQSSGTTFKVEHVFSCEIEPYKQAYIERNFAPPLLFRDVTELGEDEALTAYGGYAAVPGNLDILIAGTSCVDYSPLNGKQKKIDDKGESGKTFFGMLDYVVKHKPAIVVLENVVNAPWKDVAVKFDSIGYTAEIIKLDTKNYYIPHTRNRGYLMAVPKAHSRLVRDWVPLLKSFERRASKSLEAFLLPTDDPRIHRAREELGRIPLGKDGSRRAPTDWNRCESRHHRAREEEFLGQQRPLTDWQDAGRDPVLPEGGWSDWCAAQTERVWDLMDITTLRKATENVDIQYKSAMWELSQNVDRSIASSALAISACLTPNMIGYFAIRGGPITGLEALSLQGLPIDDLLLTRETEAQLADFAGNAMSSTAVGAAILAALCVAGETFKSIKDEEDDEEDVKMKDVEVEKSSIDENIRGDSRLGHTSVNLTSTESLTPEFIQQAIKSARRCVCEGRTDTATTPISVCKDCGHSNCEKCKSRPSHSYEFSPLERVNPDAFEKEAKRILPMRFQLDGFALTGLKNTVDALVKDGTPVDKQLASSYLETVADTIDGAEFYFVQLIRRQVWTATYSSARASLELVLEPKGLIWNLRIEPDATLATNSPLRQFCSEPVARLKLASDAKTFIEGEWELHIPLEEQTIKVKVENTGEEVPSWRASLGLVKFTEEKRSSHVTISTPKESAAFLDQSIDGVYALQSNCSTACASLHRRIEPESDIPLYFFLDPSRSGPATEDAFVFALDCARVEYGSARPIIASLDPKWRPNIEKVEEIKLTSSAKWASLDKSKIGMESMIASESLTATIFNTPTATLDLSAGNDDCSFAENVLSTKVQLDLSSNRWATPDWYQIDILHEGSELFKKVAWMLARSPPLENLREWQTIKQESLAKECTSCCPPPPDLKWRKTTNRQIIAFENGIDAGKFEKALKARPSPLLVHTRQVEEHFEIRIGLNVATLAHKALAALPKNSFRSFPQSDPEVIWRLNPSDGVEIALKRTGPKATFSLSDNKVDVKSAQPPHFKKYLLRPEQLKSLTWMIAQERDPTPWIEEEVSEAVLPQLGWHAEAKATRKVWVKGGVIADEVGYGKTAITLGLISAQLKTDKLPVCDDRIPVKGTLVIVPPHLSKQWPSEIAKFTGSNLNVITIKDMGDLKRKTIAMIQDADVIVVADSVFTSDIYWPNFGDFSGSTRGIQPDKDKAGRYFRNCVEEALATLPAQLTLLQTTGGPQAVLKRIKEVRKNRTSAEHVLDVPSRRLKGQALIFENERQAKLKKDGKKDTRKAPALAKEKAAAKLDEDPWSLGSKQVGKDWTEMQAPHLSMFAFNRLVIDEYTYTTPYQLVAIQAIRASSRWLLSGTPLLKDFKQINTIATLLHVDLGEHDQSEAKAANETTDAEKFHSYRDVRTVGWHIRRDVVAQRFLDHFARQNLAEIDEIAYGEEIIEVHLPAAEMAIYRELEHHLLALDTNLTKVARINAKASKGDAPAADRIVRLAQALGLSKSPDEALLKRCSHFSLDMEDEFDALDDAPSVCDQILERRSKQLVQCQGELITLASTVAEMHRVLTKEFPPPTVLKKDTKGPPFLDWLAEISNIGDEEAKKSLQNIIKLAGCTFERVNPRPDDSPTPQGLKEFRELRNKKMNAEEYQKAKSWILRENVHRLRALHKELLGRFRSKRYFQVVRDVQKGFFPVAEVEDLALLSCCGHHGTIETVTAAAKSFVCVAAGCRAPVRPLNVVLASTLGLESDSGTFGRKLETLVALIDAVDAKSRILVFVQFEDLFDKVKEALNSYGIDVSVLTGGAKTESSVLERFQDPKSKNQRVLLLHVTAASSSGANLAIANVAFFLSPLLTDTSEEYKSFETQAIGRLRRYGQTQTVKLFRMMSVSTKDVDIYESRTGLKVAEVVETQEKRLIKDTTRKCVRPGGKARAEPKAKVKRAKSIGSDVEASAVDTEDEEDAKPKKKVVAKKEPTKVVNKGKGRVLSEDDDDEDVIRPTKKAKGAKILNISDSEDDDIILRSAANSTATKTTELTKTATAAKKVDQVKKVITKVAQKLTVAGTSSLPTTSNSNNNSFKPFASIFTNMAKANSKVLVASTSTSTTTATKSKVITPSKSADKARSKFEGVVIEVADKSAPSSPKKGNKTLEEEEVAEPEGSNEMDVDEEEDVAMTVQKEDVTTATTSIQEEEE